MRGYNSHIPSTGAGGYVIEMTRNVLSLNRKSIIVGFCLIILIFLAFWSYHSAFQTLDNNIAGEKTFQVYTWLSLMRLSIHLTLTVNIRLKGGSVAVLFRALDLKSGGPWFKSSSLLLSEFVLGSPEFNPSTALCK